jgi:type IV pilus assembly protein PilQ
MRRLAGVAGFILMGARGLVAQDLPVLHSARLQASATEIRMTWPIAATQTVTDQVDATGRQLSLLISGARTTGEVLRQVRRAGIVSVALHPMGDTAVRAVVVLSGLRPYRVVRDSTSLTLAVDGTGEELTPIELSLDPAPTVVKVETGAVAAAKTKDPNDEESTTADTRTRERLAAWEIATPEHISMMWDHVALRDVLALFGRLTNHSVVPGVGVDSVSVTGDYRDAKWSDALKSLARIYNLRLRVGEGDILTVEQAAAIAKSEETAQMESRVFRLSYTTDVTELATMLKSHGTKRGSITALPERQSLLVNDVPDAMDRIAQLVKVLDRPMRQVRISYMVVSVDKSVASDLGFLYDAPSRMAGGNALGAAQNALMGQGASGQQGSSGTSGTGTQTWNVNQQNVSTAAAMPMPSITSPSLQLLVTGLLGGQSITALMQALESRSLARVVARQTGTVYEGKQFSGNSGEETPLRVQSVTGSSTSGSPTGGASGSGGAGQASGVPMNAVERVSTGIKLEATPRIEPDDAISLDIAVERSSAVPSGIGDAGVQFLRNTYKTSLRAKNGETLVLGGLRDRVESDNVTGVPFLMHLPLIGRLFRTTTKNSTESELILLVTAQIIEN